MPSSNFYDGWDYRPAPAAKAGSYRRKYGTSWWGKEFLSALDRMDYSSRLARGRTYANKGLVEELNQPQAGELRASVQGSRPRPYRVRIDWKPWTPAECKQVVADIQSDPALLGQLLAGTLPPELTEVLARRGLTIFPQSFSEFRVNCDCPDYAVPCKHLAAVFYVMAGAIDADPFQLFALRGLDFRKEILPPEEELDESLTAVPKLDDFLQPVLAAPPFRWDKEVYEALDFASITDTGRRAVSRLPGQVAFDSAGDISAFIDKIYAASARYASKLWWRETQVPRPVVELLPPGGQLELHLDADLRLKTFAAYNDSDEPLLEINTEEDFLAWLTELEQLERHQLTKEARSLLLAFQLARTLAERMAYVPRLLDAEEGNYLLQYVASPVDPALTVTLDRFNRLVAPTLLYYVEEDFFEFRPAREGEQLLSALLGFLLRAATAKWKEEDNPTRRLLLTAGRQRFDLPGTEGFPEAIHRWLSMLYLSEQRYRPVIRVEETADGLEVDVLIEDREAARQGPPVPFAEWYGGADRSSQFTVLRTLSFLAGHFPELTTYLSDNGKSAMQFSVADFAPVLTSILPSMQALGVQVVLPFALRKLLRPRLGLRVESQEGREIHELSGIITLDNILNFSWEAALGDQFVGIREFQELLKNTAGLVRFRENYVLLDREEVARLLLNLESDGPEMAPHERLEALFTEEYEGAPVRISPRLRRLIEKTRNGPPPPVPAGLDATLRPYQLNGYAWLHANARLGFGSVLADDMGLGKTLQVIALLLKYREEGLLDQQLALVVVPTSLLGNWQREIERFAPDLSVHLYHGPDRELVGPDQTDVLLTTYGVVRSETTKLKKINWRVVVIDEAQNIKNPASKQSKAIKQLNAPVRIAMSGTPVENRLLDYWSLLDFTLPKFLGSRKYFNERYGRPIQGDHDQEVADRFRRLTAPFVLRRLKTDKTIISDLPDKVVQTEYCQLVPAQAALYESIIEENMRLVEEAKNDIGRQGLILKLITALKQCCNHPAQFLKHDSATFEESGKALLLRERLATILENDDKVLIFTQYRQMGELLVQLIGRAFGIEAPFLHGGVSTKARDEMVERFQQDADCPILIISIKAGGTGLNLTAANHVIHYDLWWNPAVEAQATDRAYRIGQERTVFVHRLVTTSTFEEKIDDLIQSKRTLADLSVTEGETSIGKLSNRELSELVRLG